MRLLLFSTIITLFVSLCYSQISYAGCTKNGDTITCTDSVPNPDLVGIQEAGNDNNLVIDMQPGSIIDTSVASTRAINAGNGNNTLIMNKAQTISNDDDGIGFGTGSNMFHINNSEIKCDDDCINMGDGAGELTLARSLILSIDNNGIDAEGGADNLEVIDSQILAGEQCCDNFGVTLGPGDDTLRVVNSRIAGFAMPGPPRAILTNSGNDTVILGTLAHIDGLIDCSTNPEDFDTIVFEMAVPSNQIDVVNAEISNLNPAGDSIVINGLLYQWQNCESLVPQVVGGFSTSVPTLSEWGLVAMAGLLGMVGFMVIRRRKATA